MVASRYPLPAYYFSLMFTESSPTIHQCGGWHPASQDWSAPRSCHYCTIPVVARPRPTSV